MKTPFAYADKQLAKLKQSVSAEFHNTANALSFDELNVASTHDLTVNLYNRLRSTHEKMLESVERQAYKAADAETESEGDTTDYTSMVGVLLTQYNPVTEYVYNNEVRRKRERLMEALMAAPNRNARRAALNKAAKLWFAQAREYTDITVEDARLRAFEDAGIEKVRYMAEDDEHTCHECREMNGKVYPIEEAPDLPRHYHCRCWLEPVID